MSELRYQPIGSRAPGFWAVLGGLGLVVLIGLLAAHYMETEGHWVTGMSNQIVWGTPHVFAVFLIVAASGALNVASIASVFGRTPYKPLSRMSALLAITLLIAGLAILVLDLGRPDRLIVAMTTYNFKSIFAWNIFLYNGFLLIVGVYLWFMMERRMNRLSSTVGFFAFLWRLILTTGTGSIFGFLVAREAYSSAIMAPMFVIMSFAYGLAIFMLVLMGVFAWTRRPLGDALLHRLKNLLGVFIGAVLYFVIVFHLTSLYATERHGVERFLLLDGGIYTQLFWGVQIFLGSLVPLALLYLPFTARSRGAIAAAAALVIIGGLGQMYVTIIGAQAYPMPLFPGYEVSSSFLDGSVAPYSPSVWEVLLGVGGSAIALLGVLVVIGVLPVLPNSLADSSTSAVKEPEKAGATASARA